MQSWGNLPRHPAILVRRVQGRATCHQQLRDREVPVQCRQVQCGGPSRRADAAGRRRRGLQTCTGIQQEPRHGGMAAARCMAHRGDASRVGDVYGHLALQQRLQDVQREFLIQRASHHGHQGPAQGVRFANLDEPRKHRGQRQLAGARRRGLGRVSPRRQRRERQPSHILQCAPSAFNRATIAAASQPLLDGGPRDLHGQALLGQGNAPGGGGRCSQPPEHQLLAARPRPLRRIHPETPVNGAADRLP
mmetsp:Transcript_16956/g.59289  ORF Transcript_16956/g.59289 Transcript_16956/m.59289 type:complete len:248 (+) Transcript_16956:188-931(+)